MDWNQALVALVPALVALALAVIALATAYVKALIRKLNVDAAPGIAEAVVADVEAAARAAGGMTGEEKKAVAVAQLKASGQGFAAPYIEQAVVYFKGLCGPSQKGAE